MINISWFVTPESTILLGSLWEKAVPAVIDELAHCGYTVDHDDIAKANMEHGFRQQSRLEPGPATLTAARKTAQSAVGSHTPHSCAGGQRRSRRLSWLEMVGRGVG